MAYALVQGEDQVRFAAVDESVLTRVLILELVAKLQPDRISAELRGRVRAALREQRWAEALVAWMEGTGQQINIFPDEPVWTQDALDEERFVFELEMSPIFEDPSDDAE